jgi:hypothetical protein
MGLPTTFVCFSSADIRSYWSMLTWKSSENIDFVFADCELVMDARRTHETYVKDKCRERLGEAGTYAVLIGQQTRFTSPHVRWEMEVAREKRCRIIGINLDGSRKIVRETCPPTIRNIGAVFVPFSPKIVEHAIRNFRMTDQGNWHYRAEIYENLGYA